MKHHFVDDEARNVHLAAAVSERPAFQRVALRLQRDVSRARGQRDADAAPRRRRGLDDVGRERHLPQLSLLVDRLLAPQHNFDVRRRAARLAGGSGKRPARLGPRQNLDARLNRIAHGPYAQQIAQRLVQNAGRPRRADKQRVAGLDVAAQGGDDFGGRRRGWLKDQDP